MDSLRFLLLLMHSRIAAAATVQGHFWHITDLHLDPEYRVATNPLHVCPSAGSKPVSNAGTWGNYMCDSPWSLINSSIYAMKAILPDPDFILWTGAFQLPRSKACVAVIRWTFLLRQECSFAGFSGSR
uniref:Sphingomyelin phosphodiesterase acid like 3B n=1 Tax=Chrysemys picta bellii TaxID=8478 RepID=A0A8C3FTG6_CHRPI